MGSLRARGLGVVWSPDWGDVKGGQRKWQAVRQAFCHGANSTIFIMAKHRPPSVVHRQILVPEAAAVLQFAGPACQISGD